MEMKSPEKLPLILYPFMNGLTIGTTIYMKPQPSPIDEKEWLEWHRTLRHEKIHVAQFTELYGEDTFKNRLKWILLHWKYNIIETFTGKMNPLEKEAYDNSWDISYVDKRRPLQLSKD